MQPSQANTPHNPALCISALCGAPHKVELGAAWQKVSAKGRDYPLGQAGRPKLPRPIYARLIEVDGEEGLQRIWSRPSRD
ncbi:DUF736 family protein [Mesorhizobium sp. ORM6]